MPTLNIDLSGKNGLAAKTGGDAHLNTSKPHLRYVAGDGQMVDGEFNPFRKYGYMSPVTLSTRDVSEAGGTWANELAPHTYDPGANDLYFGGGSDIWKADGLDDTTLESFLSVSYDLEITDVVWGENGENVLALSKGAQKVYQFSLSTPFDLFTLSFAGNVLGLGSNIDSPDDIFVKPDGEKMYILNESDEIIYEYGFGTTWDVTTASQNGSSFNTDNGNFNAGDGNECQAFTFHDDGGVLYALLERDSNGTPESAVAEYELGSSWDLSSSITEDSVINVDADVNVTALRDIEFRRGTNAGDNMYLLQGGISSEVVEYTLTTPWSIATAGTGDTYITEIDNARGLLTSIDNSRFYINAESDASTYEYELAADDLANVTFSESFAIDSIFTESISGLEMYEHDGNKALYYAYGGANNGHIDTEIGLYGFGGSGNAPNWMSDEANTDVGSIRGNLFFERSSNGFLYGFSPTEVFQIGGSKADGASGTMIQPLEFTGEMYIDDAEEYRESIYIAIHHGEEITDQPNYSNDWVGVYVWNRQSTQAQMRDFITIQGVRRIAAIWTAHDGTLACITVGSDDKAQLRILNRSSFQTVAELERGAYPQGRDHVAEGSNATWWVGDNGKAYAYGQIGPTDESNVVRFGQLVPGGSTIGTMFYGGGSAGTVSGDNWDEVESFYVSYRNSGTTQVKIWAPHANADGDFSNQVIEQGDVYSAVKYLPQMSTVRNVEIYCAPTSLSDQTTLATLKFYFNQNDTPSITKTVTAADVSRGYLDYHLDKNYINAVQVETEWNAGRALGPDNFFPAQAVVNYETTSTKG